MQLICIENQHSLKPNDFNVPINCGSCFTQNFHGNDLSVVRFVFCAKDDGLDEASNELFEKHASHSHEMIPEKESNPSIKPHHPGKLRKMLSSFLDVEC